MAWKAVALRGVDCPGSEGIVNRDPRMGDGFARERWSGAGQCTPGIGIFSPPTANQADQYGGGRRRHGGGRGPGDWAGQAAAGSGCGPRDIGYVLGIAKAYTTRVGEGPFPTELRDAIGEALGLRGAEFGTVTGRKRRCGWFDAVLVRQTVITGGIDGIALTKLDVLDGMDEIRVCVGYRLDREEIDYLPAAACAAARVVPVYETVEGWKESTRGARSWAELPATAIKYIRRVEELIGAPVALLSTSPEREDTILVRDPFADR